MNIEELENVRKDVLLASTMSKSTQMTGVLISIHNRLKTVIDSHDSPSKYGGNERMKNLHKPLFDGGDDIVNDVTPRIGRYISFVGYFAIADNKYHLESDDLDADEYDDFQSYLCDAHILGIEAITKDLEVITESSKDSLTVTYYSDPHGVDGWALVVAECLPGGWIDSARIKLDSFEGGAAVPSGCEVVPQSTS